MEKLVMKHRAMVKAPELLKETLMSSTFLALDDDVHGIGYSFYFYHEHMSPRQSIKACAVDGIAPTAESIARCQYPYVTEVYAVARRDLPREYPASRLRDWLLGPAGQKIVEECGYVPVGETTSSPSNSGLPGFSRGKTVDVSEQVTP
jgi:ABC-type phosphate transport system substrate-binding protein